MTIRVRTYNFSIKLKYNIKYKKWEGKLFKMEDTIIYLIRHAETFDENGIRNTSEDFQMNNEKEILSVQG